MPKNVFQYIILLQIFCILPLVWMFHILVNSYCIKQYDHVVKFRDFRGNSTMDSLIYKNAIKHMLSLSSVQQSLQGKKAFFGWSVEALNFQKMSGSNIRRHNKYSIQYYNFRNQIRQSSASMGHDHNARIPDHDSAKYDNFDSHKSRSWNWNLNAGRNHPIWKKLELKHFYISMKSSFQAQKSPFNAKECFPLYY